MGKRFKNWGLLSSSAAIALVLSCGASVSRKRMLTAPDYAEYINSIKIDADPAPTDEVILTCREFRYHLLC